MKKKFIVLSSIIIISMLISAGSYLVANKNTSESPPAEVLEECKTIRNNGPGIDILFFSDEKTAEEYTDYFLQLAPFKDHKEKFNFFYIDEEIYKAPCELYKGIALYCYSKDLIKKAGSCHHDYIAVLEKQPRSVRSSAFKGVMSINKNHPLPVFAHEFAHVFSNLAEEYLAENTKIPIGSENCQSKCEGFDKFQGQFGCYQGCTKSSFFRAFEEGIMRTLSATSYGPYDELLLEEAALEQYDKKNQNLITGSAISNPVDCSQKEYFLIEGTYQENQIEILSKEHLPGCTSKGKVFGTLKYNVINKNSQVLESSEFLPELIFITDLTESGMPTEPPAENDQHFIITIPSTEQTKTLQILDKEDNVLEEIKLNDLGGRPCKA